MILQSATVPWLHEPITRDPAGSQARLEPERQRYPREVPSLRRTQTRIERYYLPYAYHHSSLWSRLSRQFQIYNLQ